jgi:N-acetylneuraminate synthase/N,N'-diacetyllegionaminate synthase
MEPEPFRQMIQRIRDVEAGLGSGRKEPVLREQDVASVARRSLIAAQRIAAGTIIEPDMIAIRRPGTGLPPDQLGSVVGKRARVDVPAGALLTREMLT